MKSPVITIRLNSDYRLIEKDDVTAENSDIVEQISAGNDFGSILLPKSSGLNTKLLSKDASSFVMPFKQEKSVNVNTIPKIEKEKLFALILDKVLEVKLENGFRCGPLLYSKIAPLSLKERAENSLNNKVSVAAIHYAACLNVSDVAELSSKLYSYNRLPLHPEITRKNQTTNQLLASISLSEKFKNNWLQYKPTTSDYWISFSPKSQTKNFSDERVVKYKIYLSPNYKDYPEVFLRLTNIINENNVVQFKTAKLATNLLRPDKLVLYLKDETAFYNCGKQLLSALKGIKGQGNPFTYAFDKYGLISGGVDPEYDNKQPESWRSKICNLLATHLLTATDLSPNQKAEYVLSRLELEGINTKIWLPKSTTN